MSFWFRIACFPNWKVFGHINPPCNVGKANTIQLPIFLHCRASTRHGRSTTRNSHKKVKRELNARVFTSKTDKKQTKQTPKNTNTNKKRPVKTRKKGWNNSRPSQPLISSLPPWSSPTSALLPWWQTALCKHLPEVVMKQPDTITGSWAVEASPAVTSELDPRPGAFSPSSGSYTYDST